MPQHELTHAVRCIANNWRGIVGKDAGHWRQRRLADHLTRMDFIILDELGHLPTIKRGRG
jgi:hypothetical protein